MAKGGHDIREEDVRRRSARRFDVLIDILPYCNEAEVLGPMKTGFGMIAEYQNGDFMRISGEMPGWFWENGKAIQRGEMKHALILQRIFDKQQFYELSSDGGIQIEDLRVHFAS